MIVVDLLIKDDIKIEHKENNAVNGDVQCAANKFESEVLDCEE